jgi:hypothetical protein
MHEVEPFYRWRGYYTAESDKLSPFYGREYSEFEYSEVVYNYYIHPQWDNFGSNTLFMKLLYVSYEDQFCVIELMGEWNDAINNDIMYLKRDIIETLSYHGIQKFILLGENVFNFHYSDDAYYEEWFDEIENGWIAALNFREHILNEFSAVRIDHYFILGGDLEKIDWRTLSPMQLFEEIETKVNKRLF